MNSWRLTLFVKANVITSDEIPRNLAPDHRSRFTPQPPQRRALFEQESAVKARARLSLENGLRLAHRAFGRPVSALLFEEVARRGHSASTHFAENYRPQGEAIVTSAWPPAALGKCYFHCAECLPAKRLFLKNPLASISCNPFLGSQLDDTAAHFLWHTFKWPFADPLLVGTFVPCFSLGVIWRVGHRDAFLRH